MASLTIEEALAQLVKASHISTKDFDKGGDGWVVDYAEADLKTYRDHAKGDLKKIYIEAYKKRIFDATYKSDKTHYLYGPKWMSQHDFVIAAVRLHELSEKGKPLPDLTKPESFNKFISQSLTYAHYCKEKAETHFWDNWGSVKDDGQMPQQALFYQKETPPPPAPHITFDPAAQHHEPTAPPKPPAPPQQQPTPAAPLPGSHPKRPAPTIR